MTATQHLLVKAAEECNEIAQRAIKAARFGLDEIQPGQMLNNAERLVDEYLDLVVVLQILDGAGYINIPHLDDASAQLDAKRRRLAKYYAYSQQRGQVE